MEPTFLQRLPTHQRRLPNGLTVIVREDHSAPVVAVVTHVMAGYFDEPDALVGISHVLEHMYFKGTERRGPGEIARETKGAGGYLNAGTIYDHTSYYTVLPAASLDQALDIQADALQRSAIDDDELRRELLVIIQEAKRKLDNPGAVAQEALFETLFDVHRIRRWRIGTEEMLRGFQRADVWEYYRNLYRAANTILVIAGDVDPDRAFDLAVKHYGGME
ncbi:MAG: M16 family metallopeptidase, partial [Longimicrobiales bacterium]